MIELLKEELSKVFGDISWEKVKEVKGDFSCQIPEIVICMGVRGRRELVIAFSKSLIVKRVSQKMGCDDALVSEKEIINEAKALAVSLVRPMENEVIPYPAVLKGSLMELTIHKAILDACCGKARDGLVFIGIVEPMVENPSTL